MNGTPYMNSNEEQKPTIRISYVTMPIMAANFVTDEEGRNEITEQLLKMADAVFGEVITKLVHGAQTYCSLVGVEVEQMQGDQVQEIVKSIVNDPKYRVDTEGLTVQRVIDRDGNISDDPDRLKTIASSRSTDN